MTELALRRSLSDAISQYEYKKAALPGELKTFEAAGGALKVAITINGLWGRENIDTGSTHLSTLQAALLQSAWLNIYEGMNIKILMSANDKKRFDQEMSRLPEFTMDNIRATFGDYISDPMASILRGLAEVFCDLDQSYKSHDKVKIGVEGLPKRVIMGGFGDYSGYGRDKIKDIINALAAYQNRPLVEYGSVYQFVEKAKVNGEATLEGRGLTLKIFKNGNGHLSFDAATLKDINRALSEYYGEVLADCSDDKPTERQQSTAVSKDLQYYPTPEKVVERVLRDLHIEPGAKVLEPSCGCGRILDGIRRKFKGVKTWGIEVDPGRAAEARAKGHTVLTANFLDTVPEAIYDFVIMNPPFYGRHYAKHVEHALKFLKPGGRLVTILPITARYDHGALDHLLPASTWSSPWSDLPVGSFRESGTNINTTVLTLAV